MLVSSSSTIIPSGEETGWERMPSDLDLRHGPISGNTDVSLLSCPVPCRQKEQSLFVTACTMYGRTCEAEGNGEHRGGALLLCTGLQDMQNACFLPSAWQETHAGSMQQLRLTKASASASPRDECHKTAVVHQQ